MDLIGLTGGIACGKSTVSRMLVDAGVVVIDADVLAREVVEPGSAGLAQIVARFGEAVLDAEGNLDRKALGAVVFHDEELRRALNHIVHPLVGQRFAEKLQFHEGNGAARVVYDVPLLFESRLDGLMTATIVVAVSPATQLARLMARDGSTAAEAQARIDSQLSLEEKRKRATYVVDNEGTVAETAANLRDVWRRATGEDVAFRA